MARAHQKNTGPGAAELLEESVHLLRRYPRELVWYYAGTGPFAVVLLYFWAYVTWFLPPDGAVAAGALLLAVLFGGMKAGQHCFAMHLLARHLGEESPPWTARKWLGEVANQLRLHVSGVLLVPLAAMFAVPFGWIYGYYQNATVLAPEAHGGTPARRHLAWAQVQLWPAQNHWALLILSALWLMVFFNVAVAFYLVPTLATRWLGLKTVFALNGWSYFNTTYLVLVTLLTHLLVDPLIKTYYLLRVYHGRAQRTGADLRLVLIREKLLQKRLTTGLGLLVLGALLFVAPVVRAAELSQPTPLPQSASVGELNRALDRVLERPDFRWRLHPRPTPASAKKDGILTGFVRATFDTVSQVIRTIYNWTAGARHWIADLFPGNKTGEDNAAKTGTRHSIDWMATLQTAAYLLLLAVAGLLIFVAWKVWRHNRITVPFAALPLSAPSGTPDLRDENVEASRLPADGWLELARQQMAAGEWRLALRALFLATLARHAHEGLMSLAKFKTNLDYESELRRRAHNRAVLVEEFSGRRRQFEEVWYGAMPANDELVRGWLQRMESQT